MENKQTDFFSQLRKLAVTTEKERDSLQVTMRKSKEERFEDETSAIFVLKGMQKDVCDYKNKIHSAYSNLRADSLSHLLRACQEVIVQQQQRMGEVEEYLKQYGYETQQVKCSKDEVSDLTITVQERKINAEEDTVSDHPLNEDTEHTCTPPKSQTKAATCVDKTPSLSDFGLSEVTLNVLAKMDGTGASFEQPLGKHVFKAPEGMRYKRNLKQELFPETPNGKSRHPSQSVPTPFDTYGITVTPGVLPHCNMNVMTPETPLDKKGASSIYGRNDENSPCPPILRTPGMKQIITKPSLPKTPVMESLKTGSVESPVPPVLKTPGVKQIKKSMFLPEKTGDMSGDIQEPNAPEFHSINPEDLPEPEAPELTMKFEEYQQFYEDFTRPLHPLTANNIQQLSASHARSEDDQVLSRDIPPVENKDTLDKDSTNEHIWDMPQPPMLSMKYTFNSKEESQENIPPGDNSNNAFTGIAMISENEYGSLQDYLQRQLPLKVINNTLKKINDIFHKKTAAGNKGQVTESELRDSIDLGPKTKSMLLLLIKLHRLHSRARNSFADPVYEIL